MSQMSQQQGENGEDEYWIPFRDAQIEASYVTDLVRAPYTPEQRTKIVSDLLNHKQEDSTDRDTSRWSELSVKVRTAGDERLEELWTQGVFAEWLLSRQDIPGSDNPTVAAIEDALEEGEGTAILTYQWFKRLHPDYKADYGFLGEQTYTHITDDPKAITVRFTSGNDVAEISSEAGLNPEEIEEVARRIERSPRWLLGGEGRTTDCETRVTFSRVELEASSGKLSNTGDRMFRTTKSQQ